MSKVTFSNKSPGQQHTAAEVNEVKASVNSLYPEETTISSDTIVAQLDLARHTTTPYTPTGNVIITIPDAGSIEPGAFQIFRLVMDGVKTVTITKATGGDPDPQVYNLPTDTILSNKTHTVQIFSLAGLVYVNFPDQDASDFDTVRPSVVISSSESGSTTTSPIPVTFTYSKSTTGFTSGKITIDNGTATNFAGSGAVYTADIVPDGDGTIIINVAAGVAQDSSGNLNLAADPWSIAYSAPDAVKPTVSSITIPSAGDSISILLDEAITSDGTGFTLNGTTASLNALTGGSGTDTLTFSLTGVAQSGETYTLDYAAGTGNVQDPSGNTLDSFSGTSVTNNSTQGGVSYPTPFESLYHIAAGVGEGVTVTDNSLDIEDGGDQPFSVEAWVRLKSGTSNTRILVVGDDTAARASLRLVNGELNFQIKEADGVTIQRQSIGTTLSANVWYHIVAIYTGSGAASGIAVFLDGSVFTTTDNSQGSYTALPPRTGSIDYRVGHNGFGSGDAHDQALHRRYNISLSGAQITDLYNLGSEKSLGDAGMETVLAACQLELRFENNANASVGVDAVEVGAVTYVLT